MLSIFSDIVERFIEVFIDDFFMFGDSFLVCLHHLSLVITRYKKKKFDPRRREMPLMVQQGIVLGHVISKKGIEVDKVKVDLIAHLLPSKSVKDIRSFLKHADFYRRFIKNFSKIA